MSKSVVLIVEDDESLLDALTETLEMGGYHYIGVESAEAALDVLSQHKVDLVVSDINMPGKSGFELLADVRRLYPGIPVVLMTAYAQIAQAVSAMQQGAADYLVKPFEPDALVETVGRHLGRSSSSAVVKGPVAADPASRRVFEMARRVAATESTVLICGESGTGKEVLARYIHDHSPRRNKPFVAINCAAIPENMLEAILFGHEKGAFTGAHQSSPGKFEQANGGTLLLDEISEMEVGLQAKLLRVLQEREVERLGGRKAIKLDVRVLATTNRDLRESVREGRFREDLFYRLSVFPLAWMPLRERRGDILPLAEHLLDIHARKMGLGKMQLDASARAALQQHDWPGNVRELDNAVQRALVLQQGGVIRAADLCLEFGMGTLPDAPEGQAFPSMNLAAAPSEPTPVMADSSDDGGNVLGSEVRQREFQVILDALRQEGGRRNRVAEKLGISPRTLRYKLARMREAGIDVDAALAGAAV
ncbi:MAG: sigma-54-dependent Fis family transcriptional regulator [Gammaproteobacteria bacterium]|nr:MAG: sigma-54-dependent Fis family transcriptional regulator [Gammaproteobacteria bacterium]